jgi:hypothetical protein
MSATKKKHSRVQTKRQPRPQPAVHASDVIDTSLAEAAVLAVSLHREAAMSVLNGRLIIAYNKTKREVAQ